MSAIRPVLCSYVLTLCIGAAIAHSVYAITIQPTDTLEALHNGVTASSAWALLVDSARVSATTLRPMRFLQTRWLEQIADAGGWTYHAVFRGTHALLAMTLMLLFTRVARVRTWPDLAAFGLALLVLAGLHTFAVIMREAFPVNHYLEVSIAALGVLALAQGRPTWLTTATIALLLGFGLLLIESGVLIWVAVVACAIAGLRGVDRRTVVVASAVLAGYVIARQALDIEMPGIGGHGSGFGARKYSADELVARFGAHPVAFGAYNLLGSLLSVLFSEPRNGVYMTLSPTRLWPPGFVINVVSSLLVTITICWYLARLARTRPAWTDADRSLIVALMIIVASTPLTISYIKDDVLSTAGVFYAFAAYVSARSLFERVGQAHVIPAVAITLLCLTAGSLWAWRVAGLHYQLRITAFKTRNDWGDSAPSKRRAGDTAEAPGHALESRIRNDALQRRNTAPPFLPPWGPLYWIE